MNHRSLQHVGDRQHFQLEEHSILGNGNAISHNHLLKQSLSRQSLEAGGENTAWVAQASTRFAPC